VRVPLRTLCISAVSFALEAADVWRMQRVLPRHFISENAATLSADLWSLGSQPSSSGGGGASVQATYVGVLVEARVGYSSPAGLRTNSRIQAPKGLRVWAKLVWKSVRSW
jgi:hypothetical protein